MQNTEQLVEIHNHYACMTHKKKIVLCNYESALTKYERCAWIVKIRLHCELVITPPQEV